MLHSASTLKQPCGPCKLPLLDKTSVCEIIKKSLRSSLDMKGLLAFMDLVFVISGVS
jgi:hypothetical protein